MWPDQGHSRLKKGYLLEKPPGFQASASAWAIRPLDACCMSAFRYRSGLAQIVRPCWSRDRIIRSGRGKGSSLALRSSTCHSVQSPVTSRP